MNIVLKEIRELINLHLSLELRTLIAILKLTKSIQISLKKMKLSKFH